MNLLNLNTMNHTILVFKNLSFLLRIRVLELIQNSNQTTHFRMYQLTFGKAQKKASIYRSLLKLYFSMINQSRHL